MEHVHHGVSDRGASVRIPLQVFRDGRGYLEDRRPNANADPYVVARLLTETVCSAIEKAEAAATPAEQRCENVCRDEIQDQQREYIMRGVEERGVRLVRLWFTDILGNLKSFAISPAELENALADGMTFDGSSIEGFSRIQEADVLAVPTRTPSSCCPSATPRRPRRGSSATSTTSTAPFGGDCAATSKRHVQAAHKEGLIFYVAPDIEFFYLAAPEKGAPPQPLDDASFFDLTTNDVTGTLLRKQTIRTLEALGIPVEQASTRTPPASRRSTCATDALTWPTA